MSEENKQVRNTVGLQIGGTVGPNDSVGVHVKMPNQPGVGLSVDINAQIDNEVRKIADTISTGHEKSDDIQKIVKEILSEQNNHTKTEKIKTLISIGTGVAQIATSILTLKYIIGL